VKRRLLLLLALALPGGAAAQDTSARQPNADLLNQALAPYRVNLRGLTQTQLDGINRAFKELLGDWNWDTDRINGLQAAAIAHYGLTLYGGVQLTLSATGDTVMACAEPADCGRAAQAATELYTAMRGVPRGFNPTGTMSAESDRKRLDEFYLAANQLVLATRRCSCPAATVEAEHLRDGMRDVRGGWGVPEPVLGPQIDLAARVITLSTGCVGAATKQAGATKSAGRGIIIP
jgi:hypothetical protein